MNWPSRMSRMDCGQVLLFHCNSKSYQIPLVTSPQTMCKPSPITWDANYINVCIMQLLEYVLFGDSFYFGLFLSFKQYFFRSLVMILLSKLCMTCGCTDQCWKRRISLNHCKFLCKCIATHFFIHIDRFISLFLLLKD